MSLMAKKDKSHLRGRPSQAFLSTLRKATKSDYAKLERACLESYLKRSVHVIVKVPYTIEFPEDFPPKILVKVEESNYFYKISAKNLLRWLNRNNHSTLTSEAIGRAVQQFNNFTREIDL